MDFFPPNSLHDRPDMHEFRNCWYVSHLLAFREQPLYPPTADQAVVYRLLHIPTFQRPAVVRLSDIGGAWQVVFKRSDGRMGYAGPLLGEVKRDLSWPQGKEFSRLLGRIGFWEMAPSSGSFGLDGSRAILEGVRPGEYHLVDRWSPQGTPYAELVDFMLGLCEGVGDAPAKPSETIGSFEELAKRFRPESGEDKPA